MGETKHEFQTEVVQLLHLMVHSLYSNKDIFLRELISNASDALDRLRFAGLTDASLLPDGELHIGIEVDPEARTLTIRDNGIGMSADEVVRNLGTIARSGTKEFLAQLEKRAGEGLPPELIGQFGVGFYSSFMAAERIEVSTRKAGERAATRWRSSGGGEFVVEDAERPEAGTTVTLHLLPPDEEDGRRDYTDETVLRDIVKRYSDFVAYPIRLHRAAGDGDGATEPETLNSMKAIWTRPESEVTDPEYAEFYKHIAHDWEDPLARIRARMEGNFDAEILLFLPKHAPFDLHHRDMMRRGIQLYVKRVFVMDECRELIPDYLRFVRGVVDSEDVSLNVSREILQQDRQIRAIRGFVTRKVLDTLAELLREDRERYVELWTQFGPVLKEGLLDPEARKDRILSLLLCASTRHEADVTTLDEYAERMKEGQDAIYYALAPSREAAERSPHLEAFRARGYEVLLLSDAVDEVWLETTQEWNGKKLRSVGKGEVDLPGGEEKEGADSERAERESRFRELLQCLRVHLQDEVKEVRLSSRLEESPVCLVGEEHDISPHMEEMLRRMGREVPRVKRILELNPSHPVAARLRELHAESPTAPELRDCARLLYGQALLAEGSALPDPAAFSRLVTELMSRALRPAPAGGEDRDPVS